MSATYGLYVGSNIHKILLTVWPEVEVPVAVHLKSYVSHGDWAKIATVVGVSIDKLVEGMYVLDWLGEIGLLRVTMKTAVLNKMLVVADFRDVHHIEVKHDTDFGSVVQSVVTLTHELNGDLLTTMRGLSTGHVLDLLGECDNGVIHGINPFFPWRSSLGVMPLRAWRYHIGGNRPLRFSSGLGTGNGRITGAWLDF